MELRPFDIHEDENFDSVFVFNVKNNSEENPKLYRVEIIIDELNDSLLKSFTCQCKGYKYKKARCKHIELCMSTLKNWGVNFRDELPTEDKGK